jgi:hypothetical protein
MMRHARNCRRRGGELLIQHLFILMVQRAGRFIQQYIARILEQHRRERQPLPLSDQQNLLEVEFAVEASAPNLH